MFSRIKENIAEFKRIKEIEKKSYKEAKAIEDSKAKERREKEAIERGKEKARIAALPMKEKMAIQQKKQDEQMKRWQEQNEKMFNNMKVNDIWK